MVPRNSVFVLGSFVCFGGFFFLIVRAKLYVQLFYLIKLQDLFVKCSGTDWTAALFLMLRATQENTASRFLFVCLFVLRNLRI